MSDTPRPGNGQEGSALPAPETVRINLRDMDASDHETEVMMWLLDHGRTHQLSQTDLGKFAKVDGSTLSKIFGGTYPATIGGIVERIEKARAEFHAQQLQVERPIVQTWALKEMANFCEAVRADETIGILIGRSHAGKTTALEAYTASHPNVVMMRMPGGGAARIFLQELAVACGATSRGAYDQVRRNVLAKFKRTETNDAPQLLIIDQAHETVIGRRVQTVTLGLIMEIHDITGCPVVICATPVFTASMESEKMKVFFEQFDNRAPFQRRLPELAPMQDINAIFAAYGLPPAPTAKLHPDDDKTPDEIVQEIRKKKGLGKLVKLVRKGRRVARNARVKLAWSHILDVVATGDAWAAGDGPDGEGNGKEGR